MRVAGAEEGEFGRDAVEELGGGAVAGAVVADLKDVDVERRGAVLVEHAGDGFVFEVAGDEEGGLAEVDAE